MSCRLGICSYANLLRSTSFACRRRLGYPPPRLSPAFGSSFMSLREITQPPSAQALLVLKDVLAHKQATRMIRRDLGILRSEIKEERQPKASAGDIRGVRYPKRGESILQPLHPKRKQL